MCLAFGSLYAQPKASDYVPPVDIPMLLAGNVGEIRPNHFHSGIDIKTQGVTGKNILSIADGYVSRISISPTGYGKALYVNHPNGTTSLYGHLESFNEAIGAFVRDEQYRRRSFALDISVPSGRLPVRKGELIAYSGNSGSSGGPHLHFEIRDQMTQDPLNIMALGLLPGITDNIAPQFFKLWAIGVDTVRGIPVHRIGESYTVVKSGNEYIVEGNAPVKLVSPGYFAVEVIDTKNGAANTMGLYSMAQTVDGRQNFGYTIDRFSFASTRYINTLVHYELHKKARYEVLRAYVSPNNELPIYHQGTTNRGIVKLTDDQPHEVVITINDDNHNRSLLRFNVVRERRPARAEERGEPVFWLRDYTHWQNGFSLTIPAKALYESILLTVDEIPGKAPRTSYSSLFRIYDETVPLQRAMTLSIRADSLPERLQSKACLASIGANGRAIYEGGTFKSGIITTTTRTFGSYFVTTDTTAPRIRAKFEEGSNLSSQSGLAMTISDDFSGIGSWRVEIDGAWALFDYDAKTATLAHKFEDARYKQGESHTLNAVVVDNRGNTTTFKTTFTW